MKIDIAALLTALVGLVGLYFHWRSSRSNEKELELRVKNSEEMLERIEAERKARELQNSERRQAEEQLDERLRNAGRIRDHFAKTDQATRVMREQLAMMQQFVLLHLLQPTGEGSAPSKSRERALEFCRSVLAWHLAANANSIQLNQVGDTMPSNQLLTKLAETNDTESRRYQEAMDCGDALVRELESSGLSVLGSGRTLERKQMTELLPDLSESFRRLTS